MWQSEGSVGGVSQVTPPPTTTTTNTAATANAPASTPTCTRTDTPTPTTAAATTATPNNQSIVNNTSNPFLILINRPLIINNKSGTLTIPHEHFKRGCTNFKRSQTIMN